MGRHRSHSPDSPRTKTRDREEKGSSKKSSSVKSRKNDESPKRSKHGRRHQSKSPDSPRRPQEKTKRDEKSSRSRHSSYSSASSTGSESENTKYSKHKEHNSKRISRKSSRKNYSDSDSDSSNNGKNWVAGKLQQMREEKSTKVEEKQKQKVLLKMMETPEEKRLRRLLKKEAKERKRKERMGWDKDYMHYTNTDNPFGDANLLETFVWSKKIDKEGLGELRQEEIERQNKLKQEENRIELEKVKKRRLEREQERAQREEEMQSMQREKEAAQFKEWEKQEDTFHLQQALLRSQIRIEDHRAKPIDLLAKYISAEDEDLAVEMHEPYTYLNGLSIRDLEDLLEDIKVYMELERGKNLDYWNDITIIVEEELYKLRKADPANKDRYGDRREGINNSVENAVIGTFKGKSYAQLLVMHDQIQKRINNREEGTDIGYWESIVARLKAQIARAKLRERHQDNLRRKLFQLKQEQGVESEPIFPIMENENISQSENVSVPSTYQEPGPSTSDDLPDIKPNEGTSTSENKEESDQENEAVLTENDLQEISIEEYNSGRYTPILIPYERIELGSIITDPIDDLQRLDFARRQLVGTGSVVKPVISAAEKAMEREARNGMTDEEAVFSVEAQIDHKIYLWSDKYRPRKPRYFNRVHTGFEWNKYNQTHYDMDNPPPKIVQGYKFNIFYPDLIDRSITPEYTLTACPDNRDFGILRFHAGPPYEDIAFKIVNREWEYSYKRGFRCQFHNNIFQLWFHFKRYRYRR